MVFAIPDWEDGNIRKNTIFSEKTKVSFLEVGALTNPILLFSD